MKIPFTVVTGAVLVATLAVGSDATFAAEDTPHRLVIQVSTDDARTQTIALNNAENVVRALGNEVQIEVIAYGPGLTMLTNKSPAAERVSGLAGKDIVFSACGNTKRKMEKKSGKPLELVDGARVVPGGVLRIMELQEAGWSYVRP